MPVCESSPPPSLSLSLRADPAVALLHSHPHNSGEQNSTLSPTAKTIRRRPPRAEDASVACVIQSIWSLLLVSVWNTNTNPPLHPSCYTWAPEQNKRVKCFTARNYSSSGVLFLQFGQSGLDHVVAESKSSHVCCSPDENNIHKWSFTFSGYSCYSEISCLICVMI